jgi:hypothetical protein
LALLGFIFYFWAFILSCFFFCSLHYLFISAIYSAKILTISLNSSSFGGANLFFFPSLTFPGYLGPAGLLLLTYLTTTGVSWLILTLS